MKNCNLYLENYVVLLVRLQFGVIFVVYSL